MGDDAEALKPDQIEGTEKVDIGIVAPSTPAKPRAPLLSEPQVTPNVKQTSEGVSYTGFDGKVHFLPFAEDTPENHARVQAARERLAIEESRQAFRASFGERGKGMSDIELTRAIDEQNADPENRRANREFAEQMRREDNDVFHKIGRLGTKMPKPVQRVWYALFPEPRNLPPTPAKPKQTQTKP